MFADADSGNGSRRFSIAFVIVKNDVMKVLGIEADLTALYLGTKVIGIAKDTLGIGARLRKLKFESARFA